MKDYNTVDRTPKDRPFTLSIAGLDPCGGAGILADIKTFEQLKVQGMGIITANTLQTEQEFYELAWQEPATIARHIEILMQAYPIAVVKIGIVKNVAMLQKIVNTIRQQNKAAFIIWDPVLKSSTGFPFFTIKDDASLTETLQQVDLLTPNLPEYEQLRPFLTPEQAVLLKGGHRKEQTGLDILYLQGAQVKLYPATPTAAPKHGSGCVLSAAIAAYITLGNDIAAACRLGKTYVERFLNSHPTLLGHHHAG